MSKESLAKVLGDANQLSNQNRLNTHTFRNDLSKQSSSNSSPPVNGESTSTKVNNNNANNTTPVASPNNSPTKSTPNKSRNKKKTESKRRSANIKKQQQQQQSPPKSDKTKPDTEHASDDSKEKQQPEKSTQLNRSSQTPSPSSNINFERHQITSQSEQMDTKPSEDKNIEQRNDSITSVSQKDPEARSVESKDSPLSNNHHNDSNTNNDDTGPQRTIVDTNSWRRKQREDKELIKQQREQLKLRDAQLQNLADKVKQQINRSKELEASLVSTTRTCSQFEKLLQQELTNRTKLEAENESLNQIINRLKNQINAHEKERSANNELIRTLNVTLMERETELSILKLKMTRMQTNSSANVSQFNTPSQPPTPRRDPCKEFTMAGRSNSEFTRNSYIRSTMLAEAIGSRSSTSQLSEHKQDDRDSLVWAKVPEELTPSKRPVLLEKNFPQLYEKYHNIATLMSPDRNRSSTPNFKDRRYRTLPRSMKNPTIQQAVDCDAIDVYKEPVKVEKRPGDTDATPVKQPIHCLVTNLDESNNTSQSSGNNSSVEANSNRDIKHNMRTQQEISGLPDATSSIESNSQRLDNKSAAVNENLNSRNIETVNHNSVTSNLDTSIHAQLDSDELMLDKTKTPPNIAPKSPSTPIKISAGFKKIFGKLKRQDSASNESQSKSDLRSVESPSTPTASAFQRGATRSTLVGPPSSFRTQMSPMRTMNFQTDKPFADWDTNMLVEWLTTIGLSMYANQCKRWVECGAHIMNATPAEVDKGLGITNHLHRKKLRLAISELNGDCDKITKAAAKLDYLWVARWLDDIGLPQYKEAFINARVDGRVLNYLTVEDLVSMNVKSLLHHSSIRCGIRVLRSINFDLHLLKRRATAEEVEQMNSIRAIMDVQSSGTNMDKMDSDAQQVKVHDESEVTLWTCHRVMEWLRMIDFAEFAPNLRGSGVHGGLIIYEDGFNIDTMSTLLSIPSGRTLLRRHLSTFFENLIGKELVLRKRQYKETSSNQQLNPTSEIKNPKKSTLWFKKKSSKVGQDGMDEYLCPMYPVEPQIIKSPTRKSDSARREGSNLPRIPESVNV